MQSTLNSTKTKSL